MSFGSTSGRGFESPIAPYLWGVIVVVTLLLWLWFHYDIRKRTREEKKRSEHDRET